MLNIGKSKGSQGNHETGDTMVTKGDEENILMSKSLDDSILKELRGFGTIPVEWLSLFEEMLKSTRIYLGDGLQMLIESSDFHQLLQDKIRLSALNQRLAVIAGIYSGRAKRAHHERKIVFSTAVRNAHAEAIEQKIKRTAKEIDAIGDVLAGSARLAEADAEGLQAIAENLMYRANGVISSLETACEILQREEAAAGRDE